MHVVTMATCTKAVWPLGVKSRVFFLIYFFGHLRGTDVPSLPRYVEIRGGCTLYQALHTHSRPYAFWEIALNGRFLHLGHTSLKMLTAVNVITSQCSVGPLHILVSHEF